MFDPVHQVKNKFVVLEVKTNDQGALLFPV